jgi:hypothetical protein
MIMRKISGWFILLCVVSASLLNSGTVRRKQTGITKSQTAGIKLKDKLEELKDGEKGPATPTFGWYGGKNGFMSAPPFSKDQPTPTDGQPELPLVSEVELSESAVSGDTEDDQDSRDGWDEGWADESVKEDEALPVKADTEEDAAWSADEEALPAGADTSKDKEASKWDKDWWDEI